jgi:hypothetical protein
MALHVSALQVHLQRPNGERNLLTIAVELSMLMDHANILRSAAVVSKFRLLLRL